MSEKLKIFPFWMIIPPNKRPRTFCRTSNFFELPNYGTKSQTFELELSSNASLGKKPVLEETKSWSFLAWSLIALALVVPFLKSLSPERNRTPGDSMLELGGAPQSWTSREPQWKWQERARPIYTGLFLSPLRRQFYSLNFFQGFYFGATPGCTGSPDIW